MCKDFCRITHYKHNWCKSKAEQYLDAIRSIGNSDYFKCRECNKSFPQVSDLKEHTEIDHNHILSPDHLRLGSKRVRIKYYHCIYK